MKLPKNCKIEACVSNDETRLPLGFPYLDVQDGKGTLVATDGRKMVILGVELGQNDVQGWVSIPALVAARKAAGKSPDVVIECNGACKLTDGTAFPRPLDSDFRFPNWRQVVPEEGRKSVFRVSFNPEYLMELAKALGSTDKVVLEFGADNCDPILVTGCGCGGVGVLMPIHIS
jgi:DNA polymerase III sliding clamp (beta) subunit (PCNA family)